MKTPIQQLVREVAQMQPDKRRAHLQRLIGDPVDLADTAAKKILHDRALLVTRLNENGLWPVR